MAAPTAPICSKNRCETCTLEFVSRYNLTRHMQRKHNINEDENTAGKDTPTAGKDTPTAGKENQHKNQCEKCDKILTRKSNYTKHIAKCKGKINILQCQICKEIFTCPPHKYRHQKKCKEKQLITTVQSGEIHNVINNIENQNNNIQNNNIQNNNNNIHININSFGKENKDYISKEFLLQCFANGGYGVGAMVNKIFFDDEHPENHNVILESLKHSYVKVKRDQKWKAQGLDETISSMIQTASSDIICNNTIPDEPSEEDLYNFGSITNLNPKIEKRIKENSKGKLIARREEAEIIPLIC